MIIQLLNNDGPKDLGQGGKIVPAYQFNIYVIPAHVFMYTTQILKNK